MSNSKSSVSAPKLTADQLARLRAAHARRVARSAYNKIRNARPEVKAARTEYNRERWALEKADRELEAKLTPAQYAKLIG
jgi:hypothetical protein